MNDLTIITTCAALAVAGLVMLCFGLRGRRINDHPFCRRCRYDLYGLDAPATCPECGAALSAKKAVRIGQRCRRTKFMIVGALLPVVTFGGGGYFTWREIEEDGVYGLMPVWHLRDRVHGGDLEAYDELCWRIADQKLTQRQVDGLMAHTIKQYHQQHEERTWWSEVIYAARRKGCVSDADWTAYAKVVTACEVRLQAPLHARPGEPIPIVIAAYYHDPQAWYDFPLVVLTIERILVDGREGWTLDPDIAWGKSRRLTLTDAMSSRLMPPPDVQPAIGPCRIEIVMEALLMVDDFDSSDRVLSEWRLSLTGTAQLLGQDADGGHELNVPVVADPER